MLAPAELAELAAHCAGTGVQLVSDEIHHGISYPGSPATSCAWETSRDAIVVNSFSEYFSMTGWRLGWLLLRFAPARRRWRFVHTHPLDLAILLLPMFRQLRALRVITVITVLNRQLRDDARGRIVFYVVGTVALVGFVASLAVLDAERDAPGASITSFGDAVWWTLTTISTVGYGDRFPVTVEGRIVAGTLMVAGIALLGVVTASIASWFVENLRRAEEELEEELSDVAEDVGRAEDRLDEVLAELRTISVRLDALERDRSSR